MQEVIEWMEERTTEGPAETSKEETPPGNVPDALAAYLSSIGSVPILDHEEECDLIVRARNGDREAWDRFIQCNLRYVVSATKRYRGLGVSTEDLIHEGNIGLIEAAKRFNPDLGYRFLSYAVWAIRQAMMRAIAAQGGAVYLPVGQSRKRKQILDFVRQKRQAGGKEPSLEEIAEAMGELPEEVSMLKASRQALSLDTPIVEEEGTTHLDFIPDEGQHVPEERLAQKMISEHVETALATLPTREREILRMRFGFDGDPMTLREIGERMGFSRERIRQLEQRALKRLRNVTLTNRLQDCLN